MPERTAAGPYRILLTGSRTWVNAPLLGYQLLREAELSGRGGREVVVVHGACSEGADALADRIARAAGLAVEPHPARWRELGRSAGYRRNELMVSLGASACLLFGMACVKARCEGRPPHVTHGAGHCAQAAYEAGIPVRRFSA